MVSMSFLVLFGFILGCVAAMAVTPLIASLVLAGTNPVKWEYKCFTPGETIEIDKTLNVFGSTGWEMIGFLKDGKYAPAFGTEQDLYRLCFRRTLP